MEHLALSESTSRLGETSHSPSETHPVMRVLVIVPAMRSPCLQHIRLFSTFSWFSFRKRYFKNILDNKTKKTCRCATGQYNVAH
jgi:hypothetical protein